MRTLNVNHFFALPPLINALVAIGYVAAVAILIYAIGVHVQLDAQRALQYPPASGSAPVAAGPCADATGIERGLCKADAKIDATKAKIKRGLEKRRLQEASVVTESPAEQPYPALVFVRDTLVWAAERADFPQPTRGPIHSAPQRGDAPAPPLSTSSLRAVTTAGPLARH